MAGMKGRSGGARANSGGTRPGAGRPPKPPVLLDMGQHDDPKAFLLAVMSHAGVDMRLRIDAAKCLLRYAGKKAQAADAAKRAGQGKYAAAKPPLKLIRS